MSTFVRLRVGAEAYAIAVTHVSEIADVGDLTPVPGARPEVLGVRNLRGQVLPVVDLAMLLRIPQTAAPSWLVVAEAGELAAGLAINEVSGVDELPDPTDDADSDLLAGALLDHDELIGVIDVPSVFTELQRAAR
jgi:purine-binding chemotaxis protein CheW